MKIAIYSPYLDTLGGGEKYMMTIAEAFSDNASVDVLLDSHLLLLGGEDIKKKLADRFNLNLSEVKFIKAPVGKGSNFFSRALFLKKYDLLFYLTDGSIFYPTAKRNILHIQSPIIGQPANNIWGKIKLSGWDLAIYNSNFTMEHSKNNWPIKSMVVYPPVDVTKIKPGAKKKYILSVGRFFGYLKDKKQSVLIKVFKEMVKGEKFKDWSLHLVGSAGDGDGLYIDELKELSQGYSIKIYPNLERRKLIELYAQASIYWHAAGFEEEDPTKMEHFGISTVEAMAAGCIPVVINKGGQKEIVEDGISGFLWDSLEQLQTYTLRLIKNTLLKNKMIEQAKIRVGFFKKENFVLQIKNLAFKNEKK